MVVGAFNTVIFEVSLFKVLTFRDLKRTTKHRYATHNILNHKPLLESLGPDISTISFEIIINRQLGINVAAELKKLRDACENGISDYLIIGNEVLGKFVLETVEETTEIFGGSGQSLAVTAKVTFKEDVK